MTEQRKFLSSLLRWILFIMGFSAIILAVIGIFLPVLPTVPFLLMALGCFARSSERFYTWLLNNNHFGPIIRPYLQSEGIPRKNKIRAIILIWFSIGLSVLFLLKVFWIKGLLLSIAAAVTLYLIRLPESAHKKNRA